MAKKKGLNIELNTLKCLDLNATGQFELHMRCSSGIGIAWWFLLDSSCTTIILTCLEGAEEREFGAVVCLC